MALFGKRQPPAQPPTPRSRTLPKLDPEYFDSIHARLLDNGGTGSSTEIAAGVANAIYNTGVRYLEQINDARTARDFRALYEDRSPNDRGAADRMIDFLVNYSPDVQSGEGGFLGTLLNRLQEVLGRPA